MVPTAVHPARDCDAAVHLILLPGTDVQADMHYLWSTFTVPGSGGDRWVWLDNPAGSGFAFLSQLAPLASDAEVEVTQARTAELADKTNSIIPRFFERDPTVEGWTSNWTGAIEVKNNGGLRWLRHRVTKAEPICVTSAVVEDVENVRLNDIPCRFIDAVTAANTDTVTGDCPAGSGADTITLIRNVILEARVPDITSEISIEGGGFSISGDDGGSSLIFYITSNAIISISDVTLTELETGKVFFNYGSLTISDSTLRDNDVSNVIDNLDDGVLAISNSLFQNNAADGGGVIEISNGGPITITNSRFVNNEDREIINEDGPLTISNSVFSGNSAGGDGGALRNSARDHTVNIRQSTFIGNSSGGTGGAISNGRGTMIIRNSTFSGNISKAGGGLYADGGSVTTLTHVTFANNSGRGVFNKGGTINLRNSIIAGSQGGTAMALSPRISATTLKMAVVQPYLTAMMVRSTWEY